MPLLMRGVVTIAVLLLGVLSLSNAAVVTNEHRWSAMGHQAVKFANVVRPARVEFRVELVQRGLSELEHVVNQVSNPDHPLYGMYLTPVELTAMVASPQEDVLLVMDWLHQAADTKCALGVHGDNLLVDMPLQEAEKLFSIQFRPYLYHGRLMNGRPIVAHRSPIPYTIQHKRVASLIEHIAGLSDFPVLSSEREGSSAVEKTAFTGANITPLVLQTLYNLPSTAQSTPLPASMSVAEFEQAYFYATDLVAFQKNYSLPNAPVQVHGKNDPYDGYLGECSLDVEYVTAAGAGLNAWMFSISNNGLDLVAWAQMVMGTTGSPLVHSISWGSAESDFPLQQVMRSNTEFMKLASLGHTVMVASGDVGTGHSGMFSCGIFAPGFPASSPFVTSVGGCSLGNDLKTQTGWTLSGGGFSSIFPRPAYQQAAVNTYLSANAANLPPAGLWNATGRGFPDVSAVAVNFQVLITMYPGELSGTSAATPVWAGIIAQLNNARINAGKKPLGFLNPLLYKLQSAGIGTDITAGTNPSSPCTQGFAAAPGWDPVTGWGTPDYNTLLASGL